MISNIEKNDLISYERYDGTILEGFCLSTSQKNQQGTMETFEGNIVSFPLSSATPMDGDTTQSEEQVIEKLEHVFQTMTLQEQEEFLDGVI